MREIKFRVWHTRSDLLRSNTPQTEYFTLHDIYWRGEDTGDYDFPRKDDVVMQYTGLKDKNGKEIYEGDIVTIPGQYPYFDCDIPNYVAEVEWIFAGFQTVLHCINGKKRGISEGINEPLEEGTYFEVIGNIYENPELLK